MISLQSNNGIGKPSKLRLAWRSPDRTACRLQYPEADHQQLAHRRHDDLFGLKATSLLQACDKCGDGGIETHRRQRRHVERRPQRGIADLGDTRRAVNRGAGPVVARIEPGIGDHLATPTQNSWLRHLRQQRGGKRLADTDDAEQQVAFAAQLVVLLDRLTNGLVDCLDLRGEMLDRRGGQGWSRCCRRGRCRCGSSTPPGC